MSAHQSVYQSELLAWETMLLPQEKLDKKREKKNRQKKKK